MTEQRLTEVHGHGATRRLQTRTTVRAPIEQVWEAITGIEHVRRWWSDGTIGCGVGEPFQLGTPEDMSGTIVTLMRPHVFEFTWHDDISIAAHPEWVDEATRGMVRFDLIEVDDDSTLVTLVTFAPIVGARGAAAGWHNLFEMFTGYVERGEVTVEAERFEQLQQLYDV